MPPMKGPPATSSLRKLHPRAKLPSPAVLRDWPSRDVRALRRRLSEPVECVFDVFFQLDDAEATLLGPLPESADGPRIDNDDSGVDLLSLTAGQTLTTDQERHLFLRLNYCRYRVMRILREFRERRLSASAAGELLRWDRHAKQTRGEIVRLNVPLVLAMAKRTKLPAVDHADLVSEGNLALLRSVDKFDCSRGFKFSTYACRAILKSFSRVAARTARYRGRFPTEFEPSLEKSHHVEQKRRDLEEDCVDELRSILGQNLAKLNDIEERVIRARFALDGEVTEPDASKAKTLEQVGEMIGVTKERVRQIQNKALDKLRVALEQGVLAS
jgi:RNA polymerase sigma factor (sigma-70 family)